MPRPQFAQGLTGRSTHRCNWRGKMILQVEYIDRVGHGGRAQPGKPTYVEVLKWRDAKPLDIAALQWFDRNPHAIVG